MDVHLFDRSDLPGRNRALDAGDRILNDQLSLTHIDDRFHNEPTRVAIAGSPQDPIGVASLSPAERRDGSALPPWSMQLVLRSGQESELCGIVGGVLPPEGAEVWVRPEHHVVTEEIQRCWPDAFNCRRLHLMAVDLPVTIDPIPTRALDPTNEADLAAVVRVNNAAFSAHPDQAGMTIESVRAKLAGIGHCAQGVRLAEIDGEINGFCWTQIHHQRHVGEISVIGLHPDVHGRGLGAPMTAAGLHWMKRQDLKKAILYVEAGNTSAVRTYQRLGFSVVHDDVSWMIPGSA